MHADELGEYFDHTVAADAAGHVDRQRFARETIDDREALELLAVGAGIEHKVVRPQLTHAARRQGTRPAGCDASARPFSRDLQPCTPPLPVHSIGAHRVAQTIQKHLNASITETWYCIDSSRICARIGSSVAARRD
jgi:hypothetical protein